MLEKLKIIYNIYDLMALCCSYIFNELEHKQYNFGEFEEKEYNEVEEAILMYLDDVEDRGKQYAFRQLHKFVYNYLIKEISIQRCYAFVFFIDENVEVEIPRESLLGGSGIVEYSTLNEQCIDRVRIIPKIEKTLINNIDRKIEKIDTSDEVKSVFRKRRECACSRIDEETKRYSVWNKEYVEKFSVKICHIDDRSDIYRRFYNKKKIFFGIIPFTNRNIELILDIKYKKKLFYVESMKKDAEKILKDRYLDIIERCKGRNIDFLIFPEMLLTEKIIENLKSPGNTESSDPKIIVNGSVWKDKHNTSVVTDCNGNLILEYRKKEPFELNKDGKTYKEELDRSDEKKFSIIEIEGIGRIGICICRDLINESVKLFHKCIGTNILLVPAFSGSMDLKSSASELAADYHCIVVIANACSALDKEKDKIGFITCPGKIETDRTNIVKMYLKNKCEEECEKRCRGKIVSIDFDKLDVKDGIHSFAIEEIDL